MVRALPWLGLVFCGPAFSSCALDAEFPTGWSRLKAQGWDHEVRSLDVQAAAMLDCFDARDPAVRDGLVFEAWSSWLRANRISEATRVAATVRLLEALRGPDDAAGFRRPFAALLLSELARADRLQAYLDPGLRGDVAAAASDYLLHIDDYRGFVDGEGWRHGVAHAADLILQLGLNPELDRKRGLALLRAVLAKVAPPGRHAYRFGEPARLARAYFFVVSADAEWLQASWPELETLADPAPLAAWGEAFGSEAGLARRHNTLAFLHELAFACRVGPDAALRERADAVDGLITRVLGG